MLADFIGGLYGLKRKRWFFGLIKEPERLYRRRIWRAILNGPPPEPPPRHLNCRCTLK